MIGSSDVPINRRYPNNERLSHMIVPIKTLKAPTLTNYEFTANTGVHTIVLDTNLVNC